MNEWLDGRTDGLDGWMACVTECLTTAEYFGRLTCLAYMHIVYELAGVVCMGFENKIDGASIQLHSWQGYAILIQPALTYSH